MDKVRFGLVGFGAWGQHHANAIVKAHNAELIGIAAASETTAKEAQSAYPDAFVTTNFRELVSRDDLDVIDVVVPSHLHHEVTTAVLEAGKHCLLEKPMGINLDQCDQMIRCAKQHDRILSVGHELRLSSMWGKAKEMVEAGFIGTPQYCLVELSRNPYRQGSGGWRYDINRVGNWILEEPIHFFDLARWYLAQSGEPESVYATANSRDEGRPELQDNFSAIMHFTGNAYAVVSQTLSAFEHHQTVKITGSRGALWASWSGAMDRTRHPTYKLRAFDGHEVTDVPIEKPTGELFELEDQIVRMAEAIQRDVPLHCTAEDGRWSVAMCLAATESVQTGQPQAIKVAD
ncbi:Gfo/Idh/MocA family protein [Roseiconus lacunae]|uniref:Gfo/Idh/MocA family oxidoreductase n=1 Tax=Roseiconus lacunae TaxID=2605694 RepID=A0ABT7PE19_9BACT|nr:Gfo/Idh/MocA family oxidoreductase [Roseiconus lacunae]MDM4014745.1 Gfo/Idh/MocA family oxidoreductase [Roseiconus lacunae]WRQ50335.1 Gfo/Idh/MocA family oxidoreductase [Stieleria sp. HD01]